MNIFDLFMAIRHRRYLKLIVKQSEYSFKPFSKFVEHVINRNNFNPPRELKPFVGDTNAFDAQRYARFLKNMSYDELKVFFSFYKDYFVDEGIWSSRSDEFKKHLQDKTHELLLGFFKRNQVDDKAEMDALIASIDDQFDAMTLKPDVVAKPPAPVKYKWKETADLIARINSILSLNSLYKRKHVTLSLLINESDSIQDKVKRKSTQSRLSEKIRSHKDKYVELLMSDADDVKQAVIAERLEYL